MDITKKNVAQFDERCGWFANTDVGMCWILFEDSDKQMNPNLYDEAKQVVERVISTGQPPFGVWS